MNGNPEDYEWNVQALTEEEKYFQKYFDEAPVRNVGLLRELLLRVVALAPILSLGSAAFLQKELIHNLMRVTSVSFFLFALVSAAIGVIPWNRAVDDDTEAIKLFLRNKMRFQSLMLGIAGFALMGGFIAILAGLIAGPSLASQQPEKAMKSKAEQQSREIEQLKAAIGKTQGNCEELREAIDGLRQHIVVVYRRREKVPANVDAPKKKSMNYSSP